MRTLGFFLGKGVSVKRLAWLQTPVLCAVLAACGSVSEQDHVKRAKDFQDKGNQSGAIIELKNALQQNGANREARWLLGQAYVATGDGASAEKELRRALELGVARQAIVPQLTEALIQQGKFQNALDESKAEAGLSPADTAKLSVFRGLAQLGLGKPAEAKTELLAALQAVPDHAEARVGLARVALAQRDAAEAMNQLDLVTAGKGATSGAWVMRGDILRAQGKHDEGAESYKRAISVDPKDVTAILSLAGYYVDKPDLKLASDTLEQAKKAAPNAVGISFFSALISYEKRDYKAANEILQGYLKKTPDYMPAVFLMGKIQQALGNLEQAQSQYKTVVARLPGHAGARQRLAGVLVLAGQPKQALEFLAPSLAMSQPTFQALVTAGEAEGQLGHFRKASDYFERGLKLNAELPGLRTRLGASRIGAGETAQGLADLEIAAGQKDDYEADTLLATAYAGQKKFDKALLAVNGLERKRPEDPATQNLRGRVYLAMGDKVKARQSFEAAVQKKFDYWPSIDHLVRLDISDKQIDIARQRYQRIADQDKKNARAMIGLAAVARMQGKEQDYVNWLEKAGQADPVALEPRLRLLDYLLATRQTEKAMRVASEAQSAHPASVEAMVALGNAQVAAGQDNNALISFESALKRSPNNAEILLALGLGRSKIGKSVESEQALKQAWSLAPGHLGVAAALVPVLVRAGRPTEALDLARKVQLGDGRLVGLVLEGDIQMAQRKFDAAEAAYTKARGVADSGQLVVKVHQAMTGGGKKAAADAVISQWVKGHPKDAGVLLYAAGVEEREGRWAAAAVHLEAALAIRPGDVATLNELASTYLAMGDARALGVAENAYRAAPKSPVVIDTYGWALVSSGDLAKGKELLRSAAEKLPQVPVVRYHYGAALAKGGDKNGAREQLKKALETKEAFAERKDAEALLATVGG